MSLRPGQLSRTCYPDGNTRYMPTIPGNYTYITWLRGVHVYTRIFSPRWQESPEVFCHPMPRISTVSLREFMNLLKCSRISRHFWKEPPVISWNHRSIFRIEYRCEFFNSMKRITFIHTIENIHSFATIYNHAYDVLLICAHYVSTNKYNFGYQRPLMSPFLFLLAIDWVMKTSTAQKQNMAYSEHFGLSLITWTLRTA
jgi:hypothetical protein